MLRHRLTAPLAFASSLKLSGKYWHRYFQSSLINLLSMPEAYINRNRCQILILAPMPTRGAPTIAAGTHEGRPYERGGHPRGVPLRTRRAPTRGAPTNAAGTHKGCPYEPGGRP